MNTLRLLGLDPALRNTGLAVAEYNLDTGEWGVTATGLLQTERQAKKLVRQSSDDYRCAREMLKGIVAFGLKHKCNMIVSEVPSGAQAARAAMGFGITIGVLAGVPLPLIEVNPIEVKMASVGKKTATKDEIIEWAVNRWPTMPWLRHQRRGAKWAVGDLMNDNEHIADACAVVAAGVETTQFAQAIAMIPRSVRVPVGTNPDERFALAA